MRSKANGHHKPLSIEQRNAIDLLILGTGDVATAAACGISRSTLHEWRQQAGFRTALEQARTDLWYESMKRVQGLVSRALDTITPLIERGDLDASLALLSAVGFITHQRKAALPPEEAALWDAVLARWQDPPP
jgi:transposase-like protein